MTPNGPASLIINAVGHCAGAMAFGLLLYLILRSRRRTYRAERLVTAAASLAFVWNAGSLLAITLGDLPSRAVDFTVLISFVALSFLPAVLLAVALPERRTFLQIGYAISGIASVLHALEIFWPNARFHAVGLMLITVGFAGLTAVSLLVPAKVAASRRTAGRLASAMCLFLLAISFVHFGTGHARQLWSAEIALHHAGIPLAMLILLGDYRFLLFDAFLRLAVEGALALATAYAVFELAHRSDPLSNAGNPGMRVLVLIAGSLLVGLFVILRERSKQLLTRFLFVQPNLEDLIARIRAAGHGATSEDEFLARVCEDVSRAFACEQWELTPPNAAPAFAKTRPAPPGSHSGIADWAEVIVPLRLAASEQRTLLLGARNRGRRYLSEDFEVLEALAAEIHDEAARIRGAESRRLMTQAELRALQAQINPHFLFNALNTIYGLIQRENGVARQMVLHLADLFRFFFRPEQMLIPIDEEVRIVRAYLDIEQARLGPRLEVAIDVAGDVRGVTVPSLCIQPLVENAVKHGAAARAGGGVVSLTIRRDGGVLRVEVANSGEFEHGEREQTGVGLANVRRRLQLWYGAGSEIEIASRGGRTCVSFEVPFEATLAAGGGIQPAHRREQSVGD